MVERRPAVNGILAAVLSARYPTAPIALAKDANALAPLTEAIPDGTSTEAQADATEPSEK